MDRHVLQKAENFLTNWATLWNYERVIWLPRISNGLVPNETDALTSYQFLAEDQGEM